MILKASYRKAKSVEEFVDALFRVYDIEVEKEDQNILEKLLSSSCREKLLNFHVLYIHILPLKPPHFLNIMIKA